MLGETHTRRMYVPVQACAALLRAKLEHARAVVDAAGSLAGEGATGNIHDPQHAKKDQAQGI